MKWHVTADLEESIEAATPRELEAVADAIGDGTRLAPEFLTDDLAGWLRQVAHIKRTDAPKEEDEATREELYGPGASNPALNP